MTSVGNHSDEQHKPHPNDELYARRKARLERKHKKMVRVAGASAVALAGVGLYHFTDYPKHGLASKAAIAQELGHVPKGIQSIHPTKNPDVKDVDYIVEVTAERPVALESEIAADLHPLAVNQDQNGEDVAIDTYLPKQDRPTPNQHAQIYPGEEFHF